MSKYDEKTEISPERSWDLYEGVSPPEKVWWV